MGIIFNYTNFVTSDERYLDYNFGKLFKLVVKTGFELTFETIKIFLKFFIIPIIVLLIVIGSVMKTSMYGFINIMGILLIVSLVYVIFIFSTYMARVSDIYIDYSGYEIKDDSILSEEETYKDENKIEDSNLEDSEDEKN